MAKDLLEFVMTKIQENPNSIKPDESVVWKELQLFIAEELGVCKEDVNPETRFYEDLNCGGRVVNGVSYDPWWEHPAFIIIMGGLIGLAAFLLTWYFRH